MRPQLIAKRPLLLVLLGACLMGGSSNLFASDLKAILVGDTAMVPLRGTFEWLGASVQYDDGRIVAAEDGTSVVLRLGSREALINGQTIVLTQAPMLRQGSTYVPLRFVAESFGAAVNYEATTRLVVITEDGRSLQMPVSRETRAANSPVKTAAWSTYRGGWFTIKFPVEFSVVGRERCDSNRDGNGTLYDGASFISPDDRVEFYVHSPLFGGTPEWIRTGAGETIQSRESVREGRTSLTYVELRGRSGAYHRAYVRVVEDASNAEWYFGIRYRDQNAYRDYRPLYLQFKQSLVQYADGAGPGN